MNQWVVAKFGGSSVSSLECWQNIASVIASHLQSKKRLIVVCSAMQHVSNLLEEVMQAAITGEHEKPFQLILQKYQTLCQQLGVSYDSILASDADQLHKYFMGISFTNDISPRLKAKIMAYGELFLTKIGYEYLLQKQVDASWLDARTLLTASAVHGKSDNNYLAAHCDYQEDADLLRRFEKLQKQVFITQGFIAANAENETVLLGRGGSDTTAAYLASKINADVCEIWTDVLGIYTANPHQIPQARLLKHLNYEEAQELASMGAKVLHPKCIAPLKERNIPLHIKQTRYPERVGTIISRDNSEPNLQIKSVITKYNVILVAIETVDMWRRVGFLAEIFAIFKKYAISIDLISTSQSTITLSIDNGYDDKPSREIKSILNELNEIAYAEILGPCASISLVGNNIRTILHKLGPIFSLFEAQKIHLLSQSANDLNLTIVVNSDQAEKLTQRIHHLIIEQHPQRHFFGKSWAEEFGETQSSVQPWWETKQQELIDLIINKNERASLYVYNKECIRNAAKRLLACQAIDRFFYAMKANSHPEVLKTIYDSGIGFECVSIYEFNLLLELFPNIENTRILFTPNFASFSEYQQALQHNIYVTIDSLYPLTHWAGLFAGKSIILRVDPGYGSGHHKFVCTGGVESKFGISIDDLSRARDIAEQNNIQVIGLHIHSGSGILQTDIWQQSAKVLISLKELFPSVRILNLGGGLGIVERPGQQHLDLAALNESLHRLKLSHVDTELWMEPGRYFVADAGVLLSTVTQIKEKNDMTFVGIETGMNSLIRPSLYGAYHEIVNLTRLSQQKTKIVNIVGPICESGDTLGYSRLFAESKEGDVVLIANVGAYGHVMSSSYNLRAPAKEVCI